MNKRVLYHKKTGEPVQLIAQAQTKPNFQDVICYQELIPPYEYYVMERRTFFSNYVREFDELPDKTRKMIEKRKDLPDKKAAGRKSREDSVEAVEPIEMSGPIEMGGPVGKDSEEKHSSGDRMTDLMMDFFDANTYADRIRIFEEMDDANEHILTNVAVSMDIAIDDDMDEKECYDRIMSELKLRKKYEVATDRVRDGK